MQNCVFLAWESCYGVMGLTKEGGELGNKEVCYQEHTHKATVLCLTETDQ